MGLYSRPYNPLTNEEANFIGADSDCLFTPNNDMMLFGDVTLFHNVKYFSPAIEFDFESDGVISAVHELDKYKKYFLKNVQNLTVDEEEHDDRCVLNLHIPLNQIMRDYKDFTALKKLFTCHIANANM